MIHREDILEELVRQVKGGQKYQFICDDLIRELGTKEIAKRHNLKEAVKETRNKLHQVGGAYQERPIPYPDWTQKMLSLSASLQNESVRAFLLECMQSHASTSERKSILNEFYVETLASIAPVRSILDLACGLNPLTLPWMPVQAGGEYFACDIFEDMTAFLTGYFDHFKVNGKAFTCDLTRQVPVYAAHVALLLKTIPCLDQMDKSAAGRLLRGLCTEYMLVSFPGQSLGGRGKGMKQNYEARFMEIIEGEPWQVQRFEFFNELAFLIRKQA